MERIFQDIVVMDITRNLSGPLCSMMLGDLGAEVIKIEPLTGDDTRRINTFEGRRPEDEDVFYGFNRNKKSIAVDLKEAEGRDLVLKLARRADVLVQNYSPGALEKLGLGYESVRRVNPKLIYCAISGFGQNGPFRDRKAYDPIVMAMTGALAMSRVGGGPPGRSGLAAGDTSASFHAAFSIASALYARQRTGTGQFIDISMYDCLFPMMHAGLREYLSTGRAPNRSRRDAGLRVPINYYEGKDGEYIYIVVAQPDWENFCQAIGAPHLAADIRFRTNNDRRAHKEELESLLRQSFLTKTAQEWDDILTEYEIPCGLLYNPDQVLASAHCAARGLVREVEHPVSGKIKLIAWPYHFSDTPADMFLPPPLLGQHTEEVLRERLGLGHQEIQRLRDNKVVRCGSVPEPKKGTA